VSEEQPAERSIGVPEGRTEYQERMVRRVWPDGTITDSAPTRKLAEAGLMAQVAGAFARFASAKAETIIFERTVTVEASPWTRVAQAEPTSEPASTEAYCRRLLCGHGRRHHPVVPDPANGGETFFAGPCEVCGNAEHCSAFVGSKQ